MNNARYEDWRLGDLSVHGCGPKLVLGTNRSTLGMDAPVQQVLPVTGHLAAVKRGLVDLCLCKKIPEPVRALRARWAMPLQAVARGQIPIGLANDRLG
jgi:hypothetical protein